MYTSLLCSTSTIVLQSYCPWPGEFFNIKLCHHNSSDISWISIKCYRSDQSWPRCTHHHYVPLQQSSCRVTALDLVNVSIFNFVNTTHLTSVGFFSNVTGVIRAGLDVHIIIMFHFNKVLAELLPLTWWMFQYLTLSTQLLWHQLDFFQMLQEWSELA